MTDKYDDIRRLCLAIFCRDLNKKAICPGNHNLDYDLGWFSIDGKTIERDWGVKMHKEAVELYKKGVRGRYSEYPSRFGNGAPYWTLEEDEVEE